MADKKKAPPARPSFFNPKSAATRFLTGLANLIIVNLLFIITCIPIFTIGASLTALYRITIAILAGDNPAIFRDYFKAFRDNFLKATLLELFYVAVLLCCSIRILHYPDRALQPHAPARDRKMGCVLPVLLPFRDPGKHILFIPAPGMVRRNILPDTQELSPALDKQRSRNHHVRRYLSRSRICSVAVPFPYHEPSDLPRHLDNRRLLFDIP